MENKKINDLTLQKAYFNNHYVAEKSNLKNDEEFK